MNAKDTEMEVKFYLQDPNRLEKRLLDLGAELVSERVFETNLRFDTPSNSLASQHCVLRLRQDQIARLTFKGPARLDEQVTIRQEIEVEVSDLATARRILEALGYGVVVMYEKYRKTYRLGSIELVLDELPYGNFAELEGDTPEQIIALAAQLGLDWSRRIPESYLSLFERLKIKKHFQAEHLTFAALHEYHPGAEDMDLLPGDVPQ
jgi:adenylate cyclase class 2